jgi:hypothetical protein
MDEQLLRGISDPAAVFLWELVRFLDELHEYALSEAKDMNPEVLHGFTSRIEAIRDDLVDELPPDPRAISTRTRTATLR